MLEEVKKTGDVQDEPDIPPENVIEQESEWVDLTNEASTGGEANYKGSKSTRK